MGSKGAPQNQLYSMLFLQIPPFGYYRASLLFVTQLSVFISDGDMVIALVSTFTRKFGMFCIYVQGYVQILYLCPGVSGSPDGNWQSVVHV